MEIKRINAKFEVSSSDNMCTPNCWRFNNPYKFILNFIWCEEDLYLEFREREELNNLNPMAILHLLGLKLKDYKLYKNHYFNIAEGSIGYRQVLRLFNSKKEFLNAVENAKEYAKEYEKECYVKLKVKLDTHNNLLSLETVNTGLTTENLYFARFFEYTSGQKEDILAAYFIVKYDLVKKYKTVNQKPLIDWIKDRTKYAVKEYYNQKAQNKKDVDYLLERLNDCTSIHYNIFTDENRPTSVKHLLKKFSNITELGIKIKDLNLTLLQAIKLLDGNKSRQLANKKAPYAEEFLYSFKYKYFTKDRLFEKLEYVKEKYKPEDTYIVQGVEIGLKDGELDYTEKRCNHFQNFYAGNKDIVKLTAIDDSRLIEFNFATKYSVFVWLYIPLKSYIYGSFDYTAKQLIKYKDFLQQKIKENS